MKPSYSIKLAFLFLIGISLNSTGLSAQETKSIAVKNFSGVSVSTGIAVYIKQGAAESAKIVANEDVINEVVVETNGDNLTVRFKENKTFAHKWKNRSAKVYITYKTLHSISASSGSSITTENILKADQLDASVSSGANINLSLACKELKLQTSSGSSAALKGTATNMELKSSSGSDINGLELVTDYARITSSSGSNVEITVNKGLETTSSSGSSIRYKGNASLKNNSTSKSADVRRIN